MPRMCQTIAGSMNQCRSYFCFPFERKKKRNQNRIIFGCALGQFPSTCPENAVKVNRKHNWSDHRKAAHIKRDDNYMRVRYCLEIYWDFMYSIIYSHQTEPNAEQTDRDAARS